MKYWLLDTIKFQILNPIKSWPALLNRHETAEMNNDAATLVPLLSLPIVVNTTAAIATNSRLLISAKINICIDIDINLCQICIYLHEIKNDLKDDSSIVSSILIFICIYIVIWTIDLDQDLYRPV